MYVGVDVGGTNIAAALVAPSGKIVARARNRTPLKGKPEDTVTVIVKTIDEVVSAGGIKPKQLAAIGLGVAGTVDPPNGRVVLTPNMNLSGLAIAKPIEKCFGVAVALGNDVNVGTLGEQWMGAARGATSAVGIFVGTGIGAGLILDGKLVLGARLAAAEIGHMRVQLGGPKCGCGNRGCLEALASRTAIERDIREAVAKGRDTVLTELLDGDLTRIRSKALSRALKKNDPLVTEVMEKACAYLGAACLSVRHLVDPEVIVLGGGVIEACGDFMMPIITKIVEKGSMPGATSTARVVRSALGDDAGVLGAAALAQQRVGTPVDLTAAEIPSATIDATAFGEITIDGETYTHDVIVRADGTVKKRKKGPVKAVHGTSHKIGPAELKKVLKGDPETLIIGAGQSASADLTKEGRDLLAERGVRVEVLPTPDAIKVYNATTGRKAALMHVTC